MWRKIINIKFYLPNFKIKIFSNPSFLLRGGDDDDVNAETNCVKNETFPVQSRQPEGATLSATDHYCSLARAFWFNS